MIKTHAKQIALIAMMAATIEAGKLCLMYIPNVEVVSLLCAVYSQVFGPLGIASIFIWVMVEGTIWGFNTWFISYVIYWPLVGLAFYYLGKKKLVNRWIGTISISILTIFFGVLTSAVDTGLFMGTITWERFSIMYIRGVVFYSIQLACNIILFIFAYVPLVNFLTKRIKPNFFKNDYSSIEEKLDK